MQLIRQSSSATIRPSRSICQSIPRVHPLPRTCSSRSVVALRASPREDDDPLDDDAISAAAATMAADNTLQGVFMLLAAGGLSSWQGLQWNWDWPADMTSTAILCAVLPVAFTLAVCVPSYDMGPVVGHQILFRSWLAIPSTSRWY